MRKNPHQVAQHVVFNLDTDGMYVNTLPQAEAFLSHLESLAAKPAPAAWVCLGLEQWRNHVVWLRAIEKERQRCVRAKRERTHPIFV
jgi:hypothetical protein